MTRIIIGLFVATLISLSSCQFTEKVYVNEDGSGTLDFEIDLSQMMKTMKEKKGEPEEAKEPKPAKDSVIYFSELMELKKDSIATLSPEVQASLKKVAAMNMKIKVHTDEAKNEMRMNYILDFKNVKELSDFDKTLADAQSVEKGKESGVPSKSRSTFSLKGNSFKRTVILNEMNEAEQTEYDESMQSMAMFFEGSTYKIEYHFPKAIKSTSAKGATYSKDKKTLYLSKTWKEAIETPEVLDFEVILVN